MSVGTTERRAALGLVAAGRALALLRGRQYALPQDVFDVAPEILELFRRHPDRSEGDLTLMRQRVVSAWPPSRSVRCWVPR